MNLFDPSQFLINPLFPTAFFTVDVIKPSHFLLGIWKIIPRSHCIIEHILHSFRKETNCFSLFVRLKHQKSDTNHGGGKQKLYYHLLLQKNEISKLSLLVEKIIKYQDTVSFRLCDGSLLKLKQCSNNLNYQISRVDSAFFSQEFRKLLNEKLMQLSLKQTRMDFYRDFSLLRPLSDILPRFHELEISKYQTLKLIFRQDSLHQPFKLFRCLSRILFESDPFHRFVLMFSINFEFIKSSPNLLQTWNTKPLQSVPCHFFDYNQDLLQKSKMMLCLKGSELILSVPASFSQQTQTYFEFTGPDRIVKLLLHSFSMFQPSKVQNFDLPIPCIASDSLSCSLIHSTFFRETCCYSDSTVRCLLRKKYTTFNSDSSLRFQAFEALDDFQDANSNYLLIFDKLSVDIEQTQALKFKRFKNSFIEFFTYLGLLSNNDLLLIQSFNFNITPKQPRNKEFL